MIAAVPLISSALSTLAPEAATAVSGAASAAAAAATSGPDFSQVLSQVTNDTVNNLRSAETTSLQGLQGKTDLQSVVQSVMSAQESLQSALAIRDKAVAAYQDVTRMSI